MHKLVCWSCGASLSDVPLPFTRLEQCKNCRADLHVCRLCRFYNPNLSDKCDHDLAEPARDVAVANFCHFFKVRPDAFSADNRTKSDAAQDKLKALFDETHETTPAVDAMEHHQSKQENAKTRFDSIFKDKK